MAVRCVARKQFDLPRKLLVLDPLRLQRVGAESPHFIFLIILKIPLEPFDMGLAFAGEDVRAEAVE